MGPAFRGLWSDPFFVSGVWDRALRKAQVQRRRQREGAANRLACSNLGSVRPCSFRNRCMSPIFCVFLPPQSLGYNFLSSFCRRYATGVLEHARKKCCHLPVLVAEAMKIGHFFAKKLHVCNNQPSCFLSSVGEKLQICNKYFFHLFTSSARSVDTRTKNKRIHIV